MSRINRDPQQLTLHFPEFQNELPEGSLNQPTKFKIAETLATQKSEQPTQYTSSLNEILSLLDAYFPNINSDDEDTSSKLRKLDYRMKKKENIEYICEHMIDKVPIEHRFNAFYGYNKSTNVLRIIDSIPLLKQYFPSSEITKSDIKRFSKQIKPEILEEENIIKIKDLIGDCTNILERLASFDFDLETKKKTRISQIQQHFPEINFSNDNIISQVLELDSKMFLEKNIQFILNHLIPNTSKNRFYDFCRFNSRIGNIDDIDRITNILRTHFPRVDFTDNAILIQIINLDPRMLKEENINLIINQFIPQNQDDNSQNRFMQFCDFNDKIWRLEDLWTIDDITYLKTAFPNVDFTDQDLITKLKQQKYIWDKICILALQNPNIRNQEAEYMKKYRQHQSHFINRREKYKSDCEGNIVLSEINMQNPNNFEIEEAIANYKQQDVSIKVKLLPYLDSIEFNSLDDFRSFIGDIKDKYGLRCLIPHFNTISQIERSFWATDTSEIYTSSMYDNPEYIKKYRKSSMEELQFYDRNVFEVYKKWSWEFISRIHNKTGTDLLDLSTQKYVLRADVIDSENINFYLATDYGARYHKDIYWWRWNIIWWWYIMKNEKSKQIFIFGYSADFWDLNINLFPIVTDILKRYFQWYQVELWNLDYSW